MDHRTTVKGIEGGIDILPRSRGHSARPRRRRRTTRSSARAGCTPRTGCSRWNTTGGAPTAAGPSGWARRAWRTIGCFRRFRLEASARLDWEHASADARAMLAGVCRRRQRLHREHEELGRRVRGRGRAARSLAAVGQHGRLQGAPPRHGPVEGQAVARAAAAPSRARPGRRPHPPARAASAPDRAAGEPCTAARASTGSRRWSATSRRWRSCRATPQGSNNWALGGSRTASGKPLVAGDPHRALDVPNVYYQNHLACPEWDAIGLSFPGVPGLPHFGHTARVAWCVTHGMADYQDLYIERFDCERSEPLRVPRRMAGGRRAAGEHRRCAATRSRRDRDRGDASRPVVVGEPRHGHAIACAYTAIAGVNATFDTFVPMLRAQSAA